MRHPHPVLLVLCIALSGIVVAGAREEWRVIPRHAPGTPPAYAPHQVIVQFEEGAAYGTAMRAVSLCGGLAARKSLHGPYLLVTLASGISVPEAVARLKSTPGVVYAEPNGTLRALAPSVFTPNDRLFVRQWHMRMVGAERTWAIQQGSPKVVVAVVDTGIAYEDFGPFRKAPDWGSTVFVPGWNLLTNDSHANDDNFHGTLVASTIAEATNNSVGVTGLAFGCALMPVKALDSTGSGTYFDIAEGISWAAHSAPRKAQVINLSLGGDTSLTVTSAIDSAVASGVVVVAASGNDGGPGVLFPASLPDVIAVGAVDARKQRAVYSSYGPELDLVAPGGDLERDDDGDGRPDGVLQQTFDPVTAEQELRYDDFAYFYADGTSFAAPHVSAAAALVISQGITSVQAVTAALESTAEDLGAPGRDDEYGYGLVRPEAALSGLGIGQ